MLCPVGTAVDTGYERAPVLRACSLTGETDVTVMRARTQEVWGGKPDAFWF